MGPSPTGLRIRLRALACAALLAGATVLALPAAAAADSIVITGHNPDPVHCFLYMDVFIYYCNSSAVLAGIPQADAVGFLTATGPAQGGATGGTTTGPSLQPIACAKGQPTQVDGFTVTCSGSASNLGSVAVLSEPCGVIAQPPQDGQPCDLGMGVTFQWSPGIAASALTGAEAQLSRDGQTVRFRYTALTIERAGLRFSTLDITVAAGPAMRLTTANVSVVNESKNVGATKEPAVQ